MRLLVWRFLHWCFGTAGMIWAYMIMGYLGIVSLFNPEYVDKFIEKYSGTKRPIKPTIGRIFLFLNIRSRTIINPASKAILISGERRYRSCSVISSRSPHCINNGCYPIG